MRSGVVRAGSPYGTASLELTLPAPCIVNSCCKRNGCKIQYGSVSSAYCGNQDVSVSASSGVTTHRSTPVSSVSLRRLAKVAEISKFGSRFGDLVGDCCLASFSELHNNSRSLVGVRAVGDAGTNGEDARTEGDEPGSASVWDLPARHKRLQAAAAKVGDPLRDMVSNASKKLQDYLDNIKSSKSKEKAEDMKPESDWEQWQKIFADAEERESLSSVLKFQLEEAVAKEDFKEAACLKEAISALEANDIVSEIMSDLKSALREERYSDAARLRDTAGAGLVGWWVGLAEGGNDPYGRIINIVSAHGRFLAKSYSARQLATAAAGIPLFEIFVSKDEIGFQQQAVYLQRDGNMAAEALMGPIKEVDVTSLEAPSISKDAAETTESQGSLDAAEVKKDGDAIDEGLNSILNFLKERMPDVKLKVFQVISPDGLEADIPKLVEQIMDADEKEDGNRENDAPTSANSESPGVGSSESDKFSVGTSDSSSSAEVTNSPFRLVVGGVLQNSIDEKIPRVPLRVPAKIVRKHKDSFVFNIEDSFSSSQVLKETVPSWKVATIATKASADLMPDDVAKVLWNVEKVPVKVSKEMGEIIRLAVSQAQRRRGLFKSTLFTRISTLDSGTDPLGEEKAAGLYIGAFGPYTSEVVQLQRRFGHWKEIEANPSGDRLDFFEYVEAIKLTGDLNVPAGQVTFRAKIGRENKLSPRGTYPEELGVLARYKGQGRLAEPGFRNPQWVDGELVLLDGKGGGHTNGAELGFVYSVPERHFLVLFNRLKLE